MPKTLDQVASLALKDIEVAGMRIRSRDAERQDLEILRAAIKAGLDSGPGVPADQVFAELRARSPAKLDVPRLIILPAARADIIEIADYIALGNPSRAQSFVVELETRMRVAAERPDPPAPGFLETSQTAYLSRRRC
jgi:hypothetical protein